MHMHLMIIIIMIVINNGDNKHLNANIANGSLYTNSLLILIVFSTVVGRSTVRVNK